MFTLPLDNENKSLDISTFSNNCLELYVFGATRSLLLDQLCNENCYMLNQMMYAPRLIYLHFLSSLLYICFVGVKHCFAFAE